MLDLAPGWKMEMDRGPNWLLVRLHAPEEGAAEDAELGRRLWNLLETHLTYRLVLELEHVPVLAPALLQQLAELRERIYERNGQLRLCGLSSENAQKLRGFFQEPSPPLFSNRNEAVMGFRPAKPR